ncbi:MAG TPA: PAS domain S-box protein [Steroidobacteraceae bacterium]|nr:PAS domain S-box protein [Steroidobacteraceae bacterium]
MSPWPRWRAYVLAIAFTLAVLLMRVLAEPWMGHRPFLLVFLIPVILAAYLSGLRPGLFATALAGLATKLFVFPPFWSAWFNDPLDFAHWLFLLLVGVLLSVLFDELQQWRDKTAARSTERQHATTERKIRVGFGIALAFLGAIGIVSYLSVSRFTENAQLVAHSQLVMSNIDALVTTTFETESAQRAYVLTGEEPFAAEYTRAMGRVEGLVQQLRDAVSTMPAQLARVEPLAEVVRARMKNSSELIELRRSGGMEAVQLRLGQTANRPGVNLQSRIRALAREMKVAEIELLNDREREANQSAQVTQSVIVGGSVLALIFVSLALYAIRRDIAGRARAESELNRFFDLSIDMFTIASPDGRFKRMSRAVTDMLGYTMDEALSLDYMEMQHPDDRARTVEVVDAQINRGERVENFESRFRHKDGTYRMLSWRSNPAGGLMYATARDVTAAHAAAEALLEAKGQLEVRVEQRTRELAQANESLRKSERRFRALIEHGSDCIAMVDTDGRILYVSPAVTTVEGYTPEELLGKPRTEQTHPDDLPTLAAATEKLRAQPGKPIPAIWRRRHKDGRWIWLEGVATNLLDDPSVGAIVTNYRDVTERLEHETRLGEQMRRLALMARITRAIGERQDLRSIFQVVVRSIEEELPVDFCMIGLYEAGENQLTVSCVGARTGPVATRLDMIEGTNIPIDENGLSRCIQGQLVHEPDIADSPFPFPKRLASAGMCSLVIAPLLVESQVFGVLVTARHTANAFSSGECEFVRQAMEHTALAAHQAQLYTALQQAYDDLRTSQQQIMQQERLRALGQMASGIAHDINNAISPVALYTEALLEREPNLTDRGRSQLEVIQRAVDDIAQTVARMGEFYRLREPLLTLMPVDLNKLVGQVIDLTRARWSDMAHQRGAAIDMRTEFDRNLPLVSAVESQIRDALVNLVFNAVDAMPEGGPLIIRTCLAKGSQEQIVLLEVQDAGVGMDEDTRRRCLEPFFTTKGTRGTGLGLAMVYGVAQRHGASLEIESEIGKGTLVRMTFAIAPSAAAVSSGRQRQPAGPMRILVIDDDPLLLKSLRDTLEVDGHEVITANGGQAGIEAFVESHAEGRPFPVVITDLGMPHVDGRKVAATIKASVPATLVLMLTGWGRRLVVEGDVPPGVDQVLSKPPKLLELRAALARTGAGPGNREN